MTEQTPTDALVEALRIAVRQNEHDMLMTGEELRAARAVLAKFGNQPAGAGEPVAWQSRTRPTWGSDTTPWTPWELCTKEQAEDYWKCPLLHEWAYEARAIYTTPQPTQAQAGAVSLTDAQKREVATNWFAEDWAVSNAIGLIDDYETLQGITKEGGQPC